MIEAANLHVLSGGDLVQAAHFQAVGHDQYQAALRAGGGLAAQLFHGRQEIAVVLPARFQFQEAPIGAALFLQVAEGRHVAVLEDQHLVAAFFHVAKKVRGEQQV